VALCYYRADKKLNKDPPIKIFRKNMVNRAHHRLSAKSWLWLLLVLVGTWQQADTLSKEFLPAGRSLSCPEIATKVAAGTFKNVQFKDSSFSLDPAVPSKELLPIANLFSQTSFVQSFLPPRSSLAKPAPLLPRPPPSLCTF